MAKKRTARKILIAVISVVLVLAIGAGCWFYFGNKPGESVYVYPFMYMGMTEYWGDQQESYGPVSTDQIQTVFLSSTQTVTNIAVSQGDAVKKGDLLMTFDTTLTDIALERERLKVEKLKLDLQNAYEYLAEIKAMKPMVIPAPQPEQPEETNPGIALSGDYQLSSQTAYDGATQETALICWMGAETPISDALLAAIHAASLEYRAANIQPIVPTEPTESTEATEPTDVTDVPESTEPPTLTDDNLIFVVFKITEGNMSLAETRVWQGVQLTFDPATSRYDIRLYDATAFEDHSVVKEEPPAPPEIDMGSGYTAAQIAEMRAQQEKTIRDLQFQVKMAESEYKIKQTEMADGNIYAEIDGTVMSLLTPEEAQETQQPMMKVSGGGGFYVEGSVSELQKDTLLIGQEVTVNDWNTGMVYTGFVESIADYPLTGDSFMGNGNPNVSYYPFTVFIDGSADLQSGSYVSVVYSTATSENGIYLENPYLRTENGKTFVFLRGSDGLLEKRFVTVGKSLWGSYTEILSGLTEEDMIAFPYGKAVKEGAPTQEGDYSTLYG